MRWIVYLHEENLKWLITYKHQTITKLCEEIGASNEHLTVWMKQRQGISPDYRVKILNVFRYRPIPKYFRLKEYDDWNDILFISKITYTKGETA